MPSSQTTEGIVALFNANDDTIHIIQTVLTEAGGAQSLVWCRFADIKNGVVDFAKFLSKYNPEVVIFHIAPPYDENWQVFKTLRDSEAMHGRGEVLTTANKARLDEVLGTNSFALEVVGRPTDLHWLRVAIAAETRKAEEARLALD
jgi:DNA-binding response OmpR family regulator